MSFSKQILSYCDLGFQIFALRILGIFLAYLNIIILANKLSVNQFGIYASVLALASIIAVILDLGCSGLSMRNVPRLQYKEQKKYLIFHYTRIIFFSSVCMLIISMLFSFANLLNNEVIFVMLISLLTSLLRFGETVLKSIEIQRWSIFAGGVLPHLITITFYIVFPLDLTIVLIFVATSIALSSALAFLLIRMYFMGINSKIFEFNTTEIKARDVISTHYDHLSYVILALTMSLFHSGVIPFLRGMEALKEAAILAISLKVIVPFKAARSALISENTPKVLALLANDEIFELKKVVAKASQSLRRYGLSIFLFTCIYAYITELILPETYSGIMVYMIIIGAGQYASLCLGFHQALHTSFDLKLRLISLLLMLVLLSVMYLTIYIFGNDALYIHIIISIVLFLKFLISYCIGKYGMKYALR